MASNNLIKERLTQAAIRVFSQNGIHSSSVQMLTKEAGVAIGSFYNYFDSKDALVEELHLLTCDRSVLYASEGDNPQADPQARLAQIVSRMIDYALTHQDEFVFAANYLYSPVIKRDIRDINEAPFKVLRDILHQGQQRQEIKDWDSNVLLSFVYGGYIYSMQKLFDQGGVLDESFRQCLIQLSWDTIKK